MKQIEDAICKYIWLLIIIVAQIIWIIPGLVIGTYEAICAGEPDIILDVILGPTNLWLWVYKGYVYA